MLLLPSLLLLLVLMLLMSVLLLPTLSLLSEEARSVVSMARVKLYEVVLSTCVSVPSAWI
jgi:hypothetical protein